MPDLFVGTAILDRSLRPQQLYLVGRKNNGKFFTTSIPVFPRGSPAPKYCAWCYEIHGNMLHVRPSVRIRLNVKQPDYFHNEGAWIVRFEDGREENLEDANKGLLPDYAGTTVGAGIKEW